MPLTRHGQVRVFTFKEGVLSAVAHDLRLSLQRFELGYEAGELRFSAEAASLQVDGVVRGGRCDPAALDAASRAEIERTLRERVLCVQRFPLVTLTARPITGEQEVVVEGTLALFGKTRSIRFSATEDAEGYAGRVELRPSDWGIVPYKALLGAIKLQDRVVVEFRIPPLDRW